MHVIIPLLFALILINSKKLKGDTYYRNSVFAIVGITFFFFLKFVDYYFFIFPHSDLYHNIVSVSVILATVLLCLSPLATKSGPIGACISITFFSVSVVLSFGLEYEIKNIIAEKGGYFDSPPPQKPEAGTIIKQKYTNKEAGFSIQLLKIWEQKQHEGGLDYFVFNKSGTKIAELRPTCFHSSEYVITDILNNLKKNAIAENQTNTHQCYKKNDFFICLIKNTTKSTNSPFERWHWLAMNPHYKHNIEIDVLIHKPSTEIKKEITRIFNSVEIEPLPDSTPTCSSTIDWF